jgi:hypothetical protein
LKVLMHLAQPLLYAAAIKPLNRRKKYMTRKSNFALLALTSLTLITAARAGDPLCGTLAECQSLEAQVKARIAELSPAPALGPIVRKADGSVRRMTRSAAAEYCASLGGRLPTAKALALAMNPQGVTETSTEDSYEIRPIGQPSFQYSYANYKRPSGDEGNNYFWSSSLRPNYGDIAFVFVGISGAFVDDVRTYDDGAVRCVGGR